MTESHESAPKRNPNTGLFMMYTETKPVKHAYLHYAKHILKLSYYDEDQTEIQTYD